MSSNLGNLVATATLDIAPFMASSRTINMALRGLDKSLNAMEKSFKNAGKGSQGLSGMKAILSETGKSLEAYRLNLARQTEHYNNLKNKIGEVSTATAAQKADLLGAKSAMSDTIAKVAELQAKYVTLANEINIQSSTWTKVGTAMYDMGSKFQSAGQKLSGVGSALTKGVTAPLVAGAGIAIKAAIDYESAFAGVKKTVDETATVSYAKLSNGIRQMAKELPASAVEIANVAEVAGQLGIKTEDILKFSRTMIDMGESTNLSAEEAATAIAKVANIMGLSSDDYSRFGASVVDLGNNFATTEKDIVEMTNRLAAGGRLAGLTAPDILGLATAMSSVGIEAEAGGTAMTQTLTAIGNAVSLTGKGAAEKLELIANTAGMTAEQFQQAWKEKPVQALQAFIKGLEVNAHKSGENVNGILDDLDMKGIRQSNMLKSLALASDKMSSAVDRSNRAWKENTALTNEANKRYATTESQLKMFKNQLTDIAIEFGGPLLQALRNGLDAAKPWITNLADMAKAFNNMSAEQQQTELLSQRQTLQRLLSLFCGIPVDSIRRPAVPNLPSGENKRPELRLFDRRLQLTDAQEKALDAQLLPQLGLFAQGYYGNPGLNLFEDMMKRRWSWNGIAGLKLTWNLSALYTHRNEKSKLRVQRELIENARQQFLFNNQLDETQQSENVRRFRAIAQRDGEIIALRTAVRKAAESKLAHGIIDVNGLLREINKENAAKTQQAIHEIDMLKAMYDLKFSHNE